MDSHTPHLLPRARLDDLFAALRADGWTPVGPQVRDAAIVYDEITGAADLPVGWTDAQAPGSYRLERRADAACFGYAVGPHSWKRSLFPPAIRQWTSRRDGTAQAITAEPAPAARLALIGVRACELAAIAIQDRVFIGGDHVDADYAARRAQVLVVAVQCGEAGGTCFCTSMHSGPRAKTGFDLALTELVVDAHRFVVEVGSPRGAALLDKLGLEAASPADCAAADAASAAAATQMGRSLDTEGLAPFLQRSYAHPHWDDVATRCLACANCTMVCPTCFCATAEDVLDLTGQQAERWRRWDSCFTSEHSYLHGGAVRRSTQSRYRQWIVHKLSTWHDQFGTSGCVGCGRCITWCPTGIDITAEVAALRNGDRATP